jgi:hypothetical protein
VILLLNLNFSTPIRNKQRFVPMINSAFGCIEERIQNREYLLVNDSEFYPKRKNT